LYLSLLGCFPARSLVQLRQVAHLWH